MSDRSVVALLLVAVCVLLSSGTQRTAALDCTGKLACADNSRCYEINERCDLFEDCPDQSDEANCESTSSRCQSNEFLCTDDNSCIPSSSKCDGTPDCFDAADEENCHAARCDFASDFMCVSDHQCINVLLRCDGVAQCRDSSDEHNCNFTGTTKSMAAKPSPRAPEEEHPHEEELEEMIPTCNPDTQFDCLGDHTHCIAMDLTCNEKNDCPNGEDEDDCDPVHDTPESEDTSNGTHPQLWVANGDTIIQYNVRNRDTKVINVGGHVYKIDFSHAHDKIFWIDSHNNVIHRMHMDGSRREPLVNSMIDTPVALAYDWIHDMLYWADSGLRNNQPKIEVLSLSTKQRHTLFTGPDVASPRVLVVDPRPNQGYIYWGEGGSSPCIYRAGLDGSNRHCIVVGKPSTYVEHPSGLTIDFVENRLLWLDSHLFALISIDLLTGAQKVVDEFNEQDIGLNGLAIFEDYVYWAEGHDRSVYKIHKSLRQDQNAEAVERVLPDLTSPNDVVIYHSLRQPHGDNFCGAQNGGCSHICLPSPTTTTPRRRCVCPNVGEVYTMSSDNKTCARSSSTNSGTGGSSQKTPSTKDPGFGVASGASTPTVFTTTPGSTPGQRNSIIGGVVAGIVAVIFSAVIGSVTG